MTTVFDMSHADSVIRESSVCPALMSRMGSGGNQVPLVLYNTALAFGVAKEEAVCKTLCAQFDNQTDTPLVLQEAYRIGAENSGAVLDVFGEKNGNADEGNTRKILCFLREKVGEKAFAEWRSRVLDSLQSPEVLRPRMYGESVRGKGKERGSWVDDRALPRPEDLPAVPLRTLWENGPDRRTPQGRELAKQLADEFGSVMQGVPYQGASSTGTPAVRRLTPIECERLMGFDDDWTRIPYRGRPADACPDSPRYRAIGNSWAVPCVRWIGERIKKEIEGGNND